MNGTLNETRILGVPLSWAPPPSDYPLKDAFTLLITMSILVFLIILRQVFSQWYLQRRIRINLRKRHGSKMVLGKLDDDMHVMEL
jgi:hypothetical protein